MKSDATVSVVVVIPVYKTDLTDHERIALTQCVNILGHYPLVLAAPHSLDVSEYRKVCPTLQEKRFSDSYFADIQGYNRLMLSAEFYEAFTPHEYMLIHQLDAFVFSDELETWCQQGYDYVGAPWLRDRDFTDWRDKAWFSIKQRVATWLDLKKADGVTPREIVSLNGVGNGGLSLRRIPALLRALNTNQRKLDLYRNANRHEFNEDVFWGVEVNRHWPVLRIPSYRRALHFAIEFFPAWAVTHYNNGKLPFGCHAWDIHGLDFWRPIFARYGHRI